MVAAIADDGLVALAYAPAEDRTASLPRRRPPRRPTTVSDLAALAGRSPGQAEMSDQPPAARPEQTAGSSSSVPSPRLGGPDHHRGTEGGEIAVAPVHTDGAIARRARGRSYRSGENIAGNEIIAAYSDDLVALLDAVTAAITTAELSELNKSYSIDATDADTLARQWLEDHGFI
jgi:hypothetical protein